MLSPESPDHAERYLVTLSRDVPALRALRGHVDDLVLGSRHYFTSIEELVRFFRNIATR